MARSSFSVWKQDDRFFSKPRKVRIASGNDSLELSEVGTWESFPSFAEKYVKQIGATVKRKIEGPEAHVWEIEYQGVLL